MRCGADGSTVSSDGSFRLRSAAMGSWIIWLIIAAVLGTIEIATMTLAFGLLGAAALVAAGAGFLGGGAAVQFGAFVLASRRRARHRPPVRASSHPASAAAAHRNCRSGRPDGLRAGRSQ